MHLLQERARKDHPREYAPDRRKQLSVGLRAEGLAASSINQCRTILCSVFNYAIRFEKYDKNPVSVVPQEKEPPGRDRFPEPEEIVQMIRVCDENGDLELKSVSSARAHDRNAERRDPEPQVERHRHRFGESLHIRPADEE